MKKIPTLFERVFDGDKVIAINDTPIEGMEWVLNGEGYATIKYDGSCCAIIDGVFYKRYDAKNGKKPPENAIPCCDPDPITGHWPHWVKIDATNPADKWFFNAYKNTPNLKDNTTYEAIGLHFNGNPYNLSIDHLIEHGSVIKIDVERTFEGIERYLFLNQIEGLVFWKDGEPKCKIKRKDFGYPWPIKEEEEIPEEFDIFIYDLKEEVQEKLIKFLGGNNGNYDVIPITTFYRDEEE